MSASESGIWVTRDGGQPRVVLRAVRIEIVNGPGSGTSMTFQQPRIRVGALPENDIVLEDPRASGVHFEVMLTETGLRVRDLNSTNGTVVEGVRIVDGYVQPLQRITAGRTQLMIVPTGASHELPLATGAEFADIVGSSIAMQRVFGMLGPVAPTDATVLLTGETGTGKEVVAEAIHGASPRANGPFVVVDCGAIPATLFENELFGHKRGAFTGADSDAPGAFERAHGGTLMLDEIGELPLDLQPKLLRVVQSRTVQRVGGSKRVPCDVRIIAATNRDLLREINGGGFRADLYYRLAVAHIELPPLRERDGDIALLAHYFANAITEDPGRQLPAELIEQFERYSWPGNIRELRNAVERALLLPHLPPKLGHGVSAAPDGPGFWVPVDTAIGFKEAKQQLIDEFDRQYVTQLLDENQRNVARAARAAGIDRASLHKIMARVGIQRPQ